MKNYRLRVLVLTLIACLFLPLQRANAGGSGFIEGGSIYQAIQSGSAVTYRLRINDAGQAALSNVTVKVSQPTAGASSAMLCAANSLPHCTAARAGVGLSSGERLEYVAGSTRVINGSGSGSIFSGMTIRTIRPGLAGIVYVQFEMRKVMPAAAPAPSPTPPAAAPAPTRTSSPAPAPAPIRVAVQKAHFTTKPVQVTLKSSQNGTTVAKGSAGQTEAASSSEIQPIVSTATPQTPNNTLAVSGVNAGMGALSLAAVVVAGLLWRKSRKGLALAALRH